MIDKGTLSRISRMKGISNMDHASKDYFQDIMMLAISREMPHLVFKGGTCLFKFHGLDRFSEDLDMNGTAAQRDIGRIGAYLADYGYRNDIETYKMKSGLLVTFKIRGFLYNGDPVSMTRVRLDVTMKDGTLLEPLYSTYHSLYPDLPSFNISTMDPKEIIAEKFRSLFQRSKGRDLYDLIYLMEKGIEPDRALLRKKLRIYRIDPDRSVLEGSLERIERSWEMELKGFVLSMPSFKDRRDEVLDLYDRLIQDGSL